MNELERRMKNARIREEDLDERFVLGSGSGGQKINKTSSRVYLKHRPTGIEVQCQESRSRDRNRELARLRLCDKIEEAEREKQLERSRERALKRYRKRRPSRATKAKVRRDKQHRSEKKQSRGRVES